MSTVTVTKGSALIVGLTCAAALVVSCSSDADDTATGPGGSIEVTTSEAAAFQPKDVEPTTVEDFTEFVGDTGLNVRWKLQGTVGSNAGGAVITLAVHNLNDVPLPADAIGDPTLTLNDGTQVNRLDAEAAGVAGQDGLDRPLGVGATTNLRYAFDVAPGNLWDAQFKIGNVIFKGNLNR
ncbi:hypothetical protein ACUY3K_06395 [Corynebacterium uberis]|uniref:hypothetical protein n=1 Tax=Corynebacterium TaxID=1716 RepID=UPI001D0AD20B|nr:MULTISPECIES: hypothetical protein [Corynebacterium]MCZ9308192.1 hypothetical protein [Corynebacterium sp. c6VSa_13]UDL73873.1 hypothetical protein LH391_01185 [Corynebacterium uberis]UDL75244.1 hypothetical protein LH393_08230 [Corynebacterium uberis]UDL77455.1 hypothetical protein LH394_08210 [Corynebacterium uberis]UDL79741.1 hypothetical protein LH392_08640 [Corynebacterium uberis]